jgi:hypothetical protein
MFLVKLERAVKETRLLLQPKFFYLSNSLWFLVVNTTFSIFSSINIILFVLKLFSVFRLFQKILSFLLILVHVKGNNLSDEEIIFFSFLSCKLSVPSFHYVFSFSFLRNYNRIRRRIKLFSFYLEMRQQLTICMSCRANKK